MRISLCFHSSQGKHRRLWRLAVAPQPSIAECQSVPLRGTIFRWRCRTYPQPNLGNIRWISVLCVLIVPDWFWNISLSCIRSGRNTESNYQRRKRMPYHLYPDYCNWYHNKLYISLQPAKGLVVYDCYGNCGLDITTTKIICG